ncbi:MAG: hypothetical protein UIH99_04860, partial [Alphaproteobacteria bacterium]|nr:hypothetical protein [Alphaproteobacteria bacterium]
ANSDVVTEDIVKADIKECKPFDLINVRLAAYGTEKTLEEIRTSDDFAKITADKIFKMDEKNNMTSGTPADSNKGGYAEISSGSIPGARQAALIANIQDSTFGLRKDDWTKIKARGGLEIYGRDAKGDAFKLGEDVPADIEAFHVMYRDSGDGGFVDFGNKARLKATAIGAGVGAGLGAFTAYQGAQSDIEQRWVAEVRAYKDSLMKFVCRTGTRFLSSYNDTVVIPSGI